jgi:hypothetical protein
MEPVPDREVLPFPKEAWRAGIFADYRDAMKGTTEASDAAHFATLWAAIAISLGRKVHLYSGDDVYPNVYLCIVGPTGDKKTTAMRRIWQYELLGAVPDLRRIGSVGSTEGLGATLQQDGQMQCLALFIWEEISSLLARGRWVGSTVLQFLTETFDCPPEWGLEYTKERLRIVQPTFTILSGTTADWFWKNARDEDFRGGFGNRVLFLSGQKKSPLSNPAKPDPEKMDEIRKKLRELLETVECEAAYESAALKLWDDFYVKWAGEESRLRVQVDSGWPTIRTLSGRSPGSAGAS